MNRYEMKERFEEAITIFPKHFNQEMLNYIAKADQAHDIDHIMWVVNNALDLMAKLPEKTDEFRKEIILAAFCHDIGCFVGREEHHTHSADLLARHYTQLPKEINLALVDSAIRKHRASYKGDRTHIVEELVAAADRGEPNLNGYLRRSVKYNIGTVKDLDTYNKFVDTVYGHMKKKFGRMGYAYMTAPRFWLEMYTEQIGEMTEAFEDKEHIMFLIHQFYKEEAGRASIFGKTLSQVVEFTPKYPYN